jgi:hypothetical protein
MLKKVFFNALYLPVLEVVILQVLVGPRLTQVDSGAYPRGGRLTLEA